MSRDSSPIRRGGALVPLLYFQNHSLTAVELDNEVWLPGAELARALGYPREDNVSRLYRRHADEFSPGMTRLAQLPLPGDLERQNGVPNQNIPTRGRGNPAPPARVFSLRGCHLIAMLARTPVAKAFRRWVLDILDALAKPAGEDGDAWRISRAVGYGMDFRLMYFEAGEKMGSLRRLPEARRKQVLKVCGLLSQGLRPREIAEQTWLRREAVAYIARRYYRELDIDGLSVSLAADCRKEQQRQARERAAELAARTTPEVPSHE